MVALPRAIISRASYPGGDASIPREAREYMLLLFQAARKEKYMVVRGHRPSCPSLTFGRRYAMLNMREVAGLFTIWRANIRRILCGRLKGGIKKAGSETGGLPNYTGT